MNERKFKGEPESTSRAIKFLEGILRSSNDGIVVTDTTKNIIVANEAFCSFFGRKWREVIETNLFVWLDQLDEGAPEQWVRLSKETCRKGFCHNVEFRKITAQGILYLSVNASILDEGTAGEQGVIISIWRDITKQKEMEEKILLSERLAVLGKVSGSISHEIRNPLGVIDSSAYYLQMRLQDADEKTITHLSRIKTQVKKASEIIQSLLDVARMKEPLKISQNIVECIEDSLRVAHIPRKVKIIRRITTNTCIVEADKTQLAMVFENIVTNAIQAMEDGGTLTISLEMVTDDISGDSIAEICFQDTGPGIAPENKNKIFEPLFSTKTNGIGFGLTLCKMIIERHGGTITVHSEKGKGANFIIRLRTRKNND
ncbi:MAG: ATP-binding protein [Candidatus Brocadiaceae bacterium]|nr:ATP-binding protein [Candidatus Brocadiaceae bacterium]